MAYIIHIEDSQSAMYALFRTDKGLGSTNSAHKVDSRDSWNSDKMAAKNNNDNKRNKQTLLTSIIVNQVYKNVQCFKHHIRTDAL